MVAAVFATLAALGFAGAAVSSKRGLQHISTLGGFAISLPAGLVVIAVIAAFDPPQSVPLRAVLFLVAAGLFGSAVGRLLAIAGLRRLDTPVYIPLQTSTHPLVGVLGGLLLFGERIGLVRGAGAVAIVAGIWVLTRAGTPPELLGEAEAPTPRRLLTRARHRVGLAVLFPIGAGLAFGGADITTKEAMTLFPHPAAGAAIAIFASCVVWGALLGLSPGLRAQTTFGPGKRWFVLHGALAALAIMCSYAALERGDVSVVSPIIASQPCWVLLLSALFLRRIETVTPRAIAGSLLVVAGAVLVSVS